MIEIKQIGKVVGWDAAIIGMRNPKNSWAKSDSYWTHIEDEETLETADFEFFMGDNDLKLAATLAKAGTDHGKFLRFLNVYVTINAPMYWHKEMDTYRMGVEKNSCSTMHKIQSKKFTREDFSTEHMNQESLMVLDMNIHNLNMNRDLFNVSGDKEDWWQMIQGLPMSYNQKRTYMMNYAALRNIYHARKNHKLDEWHCFCEWIETLPYAKELICEL